MFLVFETDYFAFLDAFEMCEKWMWFLAIGIGSVRSGDSVARSRSCWDVLVLVASLMTLAL